MCSILLHHYTVCTTLAVNTYKHITFDGTLSQYCLLTACLTVYLQFKTILKLHNCTVIGKYPIVGVHSTIYMY